MFASTDRDVRGLALMKVLGGRFVSYCCMQNGSLQRDDAPLATYQHLTELMRVSQKEQLSVKEQNSRARSERPLCTLSESHHICNYASFVRPRSSQPTHTNDIMTMLQAASVFFFQNTVSSSAWRGEVPPNRSSAPTIR